MNAKLTPETIWSIRAHDFRKEILPYLRYMAQSGFPAFMSLIFISGAIGYFTLLRNVPDDFPFAAVGVAVLMPVICWSPLRTWLAVADTVFMMPRESQMGPYLKRSFRHNAIGGGLLAAIVLLLYIPLHRQSEAELGGVWIILIVALLKAANAWGAWRERQLTWPGMRRFIRITRWVLTGIVLTAWLTSLLWQASALTGLAALLLGLIYRLPARHSFPWERLIEEERRTRKRYYVFFGLFIDVPTTASATARRAYLTWLLRLIPYSRRYTFFYLYTASLLRMETGGIILRLLGLGCLILYWLGDAAALDGWIAAAGYAIFLSVIALQLGGLRHVHRYSVWHHVYPLPDSQRLQQYVKLDRMTLAITAFLLWLFAAVPLIAKGLYTAPAVIGVLSVLYIVVRPSRLAKLIRKEMDEE